MDNMITMREVQLEKALRDYYQAAERYMVGQRLGRMAGSTIDKLTKAKAAVEEVLNGPANKDKG